MHDSLQTYLNDHLAGAGFGLSLLESLKSSKSAELASFASRLIEDIQADRNVVEQLVHREGKVSAWKQATGHVMEWTSRLKRQWGTPEFGEFEALELLAIGIQGKLSLWTALAVVGDETPALRGIQLEVMAQRAMDQYQRVEAKRIEWARSALKARDVAASPSTT